MSVLFMFQFSSILCICVQVQVGYSRSSAFNMYHIEKILMHHEDLSIGMVDFARYYNKHHAPVLRWRYPVILNLDRYITQCDSLGKCIVAVDNYQGIYFTPLTNPLIVRYPSPEFLNGGEGRGSAKECSLMVAT